MKTVRRAKWFVVVAMVMSCWMGVCASLQGVAEAGVIGSHLADGAGAPQDLAQVQSFLENKIVVQKLVDYGVTPEQALAKVQGMSAEDLHRLASLTERAAVGADGSIGLIGLLVAIILIIVILRMTGTSVVVR
jgi:hypothetical protein